MEVINGQTHLEAMNATMPLMLVWRTTQELSSLH